MADDSAIARALVARRSRMEGRVVSSVLYGLEAARLAVGVAQK
jgi:hypothetical protein